MAVLRVLVVHDDAPFLERVRTGVAAMNPDAEVVSAISAPRALGMAKQQAPDVIIADGDLMGMDGYALAAEAKSDAALDMIPVIIVVNSPNEASALKARQVGAAAHLPVSVDTATLMAKVMTVVGDSEDGLEADSELEPVFEDAAPSTEGDDAVEPGVMEPMSYGELEAETPDEAPETSLMPEPAPEPAEATPDSVEVPVAVPTSPFPGTSGYGAPQPPLADAVSGPAPRIGEDARPPTGDEAPHVDDLLRLMIERGGSDVHITAGSAPGLRLRGDIVPIENTKVLTPRDTQAMLLTLLSEEQRRRFETELELDFAYSIPGLSRFRANVFQQRNSMGAVFRVIPLKIPTLDELGLPKVCRFLAERPRGLVLVTGPTGSGKSTTLAAMLNHINEHRPVHIITMEDPIEFMHRNKKAYVNQREVGEDTHSFAAALKRVLRQDPDVILVGEMRDLETISAALTAAETGHLVLATLHTTGGPETVDRVIDVFPPHQQQQVRMQLSTTLEGVLSQTLLRSTDGKSRVMAMEIMLGIPAISNLIREGKTHQMATIIQGGASFGMQTLDQHLKVLLQGGKITYEEAIQKAKEPRELAQMLGRKV